MAPRSTLGVDFSLEHDRVCRSAHWTRFANHVRKKPYIIGIRVCFFPASRDLGCRQSSRRDFLCLACVACQATASAQEQLADVAVQAAQWSSAETQRDQALALLAYHQETRLSSVTARVLLRERSGQDRVLIIDRGFASGIRASIPS